MKAHDVVPIVLILLLLLQKEINEVGGKWPCFLRQSLMINRPV